MTEEFKKYPIYKINAEINSGTKHIEHYFSKRMFKTLLTEKELNAELKACKELLLSKEAWYIDGDMKPASELNINIASCSIEYFEDESWCLVWFNHYTIDNGEDDEYFSKSFQDFVSRMKKFNSQNGTWVTMENGTAYYREPYCLMGAEERWRWCRFDDDGNKVYDDKPCRCKDCKEQGVVRWIH